MGHRDEPNSNQAPGPEPGWREDPRLRGRFHRQCLDDIQVLVHDGGPRFSSHRPEAVWVTVTECRGDVFRGVLVNQPEQLRRVSKGDSVRFIVPESGPYPLQVSEKYLRERADWAIHPCDGCGLSELFDAPTDLIDSVFDVSDGFVPEVFTALCAACGGQLIVQRTE